MAGRKNISDHRLEPAVFIFVPMVLVHPVQVEHVLVLDRTGPSPLKLPVQQEKLPREKFKQLFPILLDTSNLPKRKDRKSTRLNSSHVRISYAVFCLKKKTK